MTAESFSLHLYIIMMYFVHNSLTGHALSRLNIRFSVEIKQLKFYICSIDRLRFHIIWRISLNGNWYLSFTIPPSVSSIINQFDTADCSVNGKEADYITIFHAMPVNMF